ncbi:MAG: hypothetical protein H0V82_10885 [Candidatus Protochlamydia sp.]|nr:hypothetical protein [Candidatus Protochlamydia sp.]
MSDPMLFDLMHGVGLPSKSGNKAPLAIIKDPLEIEFNEAIQEQIKSEMENEVRSEYNLLSPAMKQAKRKQEIIEEASFKEVSQNLSLAVKILMDEGSQVLEKEEYDDLLKSLVHINSNLDSLEPKHLNDESLQAALKIPDTCGRFILKIGVDKYSQGLVDESIALFLLLTIVNPDEPDYWFRLGLAAKKNQNYSLALNALATTTELAPEFIGAHIYAAHCHLKMYSKENALAEFAIAKEIQEKTQIEEKWLQSMNEVENLLAVI